MFGARVTLRAAGCRKRPRAVGTQMSFDLSHQIDACNRRIGLVRTLIEQVETRGETTTDAERQFILETELHRMFEAQLAADDGGSSKQACALNSS